MTEYIYSTTQYYFFDVVVLLTPTLQREINILGFKSLRLILHIKHMLDLFFGHFHLYLRKFKEIEERWPAAKGHEQTD